jgi:hypothetical protein
MTVLGDLRGYAESASAKLVQHSRGEPEFRKDMSNISTENCIHTASSHRHDDMTPLRLCWYVLDKVAPAQPSTSVKYTPTTDSSSTTIIHVLGLAVEFGLQSPSCSVAKHLMVRAAILDEFKRCRKFSFFETASSVNLLFVT